MLKEGAKQFIKRCIHIGLDATKPFIVEHNPYLKSHLTIKPTQRSIVPMPL